MPSLLEAINEKYGYGDEVFDQTPVAIYVPKRSPRKYIPSLLVLNDCDIDSAGHEIDLQEKCKTVEDLDLAQNNLSQWNEVSAYYRIKILFLFLSTGNRHTPAPNTRSTYFNYARQRKKLMLRNEICTV